MIFVNEQFTPLPNRSTCGQVAGNRRCGAATAGGGPAYVVFFRHCDEGFSCDHSATWTGCRGCEFIKQDNCATNDCNSTGIQRAYGYGKWLSCFGKATGAPAAAIFSQDPTHSGTNARPMATAAMLYDSLLRLANVAPADLCWSQFDRAAASSPSPRSNPLVAALGSTTLAGKTVAVVWDHGNVQYILQALGVPLNGWWWNGCCYDQAVVVDMRKRSMRTYQLNTEGGGDPCAGANCQAATAPFAGCPGPWPVPFAAAATTTTANLELALAASPNRLGDGLAADGDPAIDRPPMLASYALGSHLDMNAGSGLHATMLIGDRATLPGAKIKPVGSRMAAPDMLRR